jgi:cytochrome c556
MGRWAAKRLGGPRVVSTVTNIRQDARMTRTATTAAAFALSAVLLLAGCGGADPNSPAGKRHAAYEQIGKADKALGKILEQAQPNLAEAAEPVATIKAQVALLPGLFPPGAGPESGQKTDAKPEIWSNPTQFAAEMHGLTTAVDALDAARQTGDVTATRAAAAAVNKTCKSCHSKFRKK